MPSVAKYHIFKEKNFQGLVYCDYRAKLLWGTARQGVQCSECGYNCHVACSDMVIQCRPTRRLSPDSLSVTDSEAESVSKYSVHSHCASFDRYLDDNKSTHSNSSRKHPKMLEDLPRTSSSSKLLDESVLKSPTFSTGSTSGPPPNNDLRSKASLNKAYRKSLKQKLQQHSNGNGHSNDITMSPHATAKAFTRLVARSKAFFYIGKSIHDIYSWKNNAYSLLVCLFWVCSCLNSFTVLLIPPLLICLLYTQTGVIKQPASQILFPRFDENTPEYYINLENMQYAFLFFIRLYDNLAYHLHHITLNATTYRVLLVTSLVISSLFYICGKWLLMAVGLMLLLNKTWVGTSLEILLQFLMEVLQTFVDLAHKLKRTKKPSLPSEPIQISIYENQRWWAGSGYTSQLLRSERSGWSNITGLEPLPPKDDMPSPMHYTWADDDDWHLDTTGPWVDDALEIVVSCAFSNSAIRTLIECDEDGWVYSDHRWSNPRNRPEAATGRTPALANGHGESSRALTRRRRWYRTANPIANFKLEKAL
ncbi:unnamed protein product [Mucor hiemalis]